jgi:hypothetical protein
MTPAETLALVGDALYGPKWRTPMARDLDVAESTLRHWTSGRREITASHPIFAELRDLVDAHLAAIGEARKALDGIENGASKCCS